MIDLDITKILATRLEAQYPGVYVGSPLAPDSIVLPAILLEIDSEVVVGSALVDALKSSLDAQGRATPSSVEAVTTLVSSIAGGVREGRKNAGKGGGLFCWLTGLFG